MASKLTKEFREQISEMFVNCLEEDGLNWKKGWKGLNAPERGVSGEQYKGVNRFYLSVLMMKNGWDDNRFMTFNAIKEKGWKLQAGSKGCKVEYWMPYDSKEKKCISWSEYKKLIKGMDRQEIDDRFGLRARYSTVFNGSMIDGIPERKMENENVVEVSEIIGKISDGLGVEILNDGGDSAFYRPSEDKIHMPAVKAFRDSYSYNATALHELGHSTGAAHRLNRDIKNMFGSEDYAYEELIAEITSCFMSCYLGNEIAEVQDFNNHKAYVQSWIQAIKDKPESLFSAIKEAEKAAEYMEEKGRLKEKEQVEEKDEKCVGERPKER